MITKNGAEKLRVAKGQIGNFEVEIAPRRSMPDEEMYPARSQVPMKFFRKEGAHLT